MVYRRESPRVSPTDGIRERRTDEHPCEDRRNGESKKWHNVFLTARAGLQ
jgi:hypothetical protein